MRSITVRVVTPTDTFHENGFWFKLYLELENGNAWSEAMDQDYFEDRIAGLEAELSELKDLTINMGRALAVALGEVAESSGGHSFMGVGVEPHEVGFKDIQAVHEAFRRGQAIGRAYKDQ
ncbi:hypothetical protein BOO69_12650 [Sulfitobacter alexandrii]|uniref:Uncharacterized protein n=2 Tax=Sulfitobacter alexandrii TaxID=1917485 RepID=A0A1J0WIL2_9RHOB|nr:hypothetical protein BOO69_12650 [Sulfitobacter alexandrii]